MSARTESSSEPAPIEISQTTTASRVSRFAHAMHDALQELELKKNPATPHDLRRTVASHMAAMGIGDDVVARVLKHASEIGKTITGSVYIRHSFAAEKRHALEAWSAELERIINAKDAGYNVVRIARH
jgi:integrase